MPEPHVVTKREIVATIPSLTDRLQVRIDFLAESVRYRLWQVERCLDPSYYPLSEQTRAQVLAQRASKVLLERNADCPSKLRDIIDNHGIVAASS